MRDALAIFLGSKVRVEGTLHAVSEIRAFAGRRDTMLCLVDVRTPAGEALADHVWVRQGRRLRALELHKGDRVAFTATVVDYVHANGDPDVKLVRPHMCRALERAPSANPAPTTAPPPPLPHGLPVLETLHALSQAYGKPPTLPDVCQRTGLRPWEAVLELYRLAKVGRVALDPRGHVFIVPTAMEGASL